MRPYTITHELAGSVAQLGVSGHLDASDHWHEHPLQRRTYVAFIRGNRYGIKFAYKTVGPILLNNNFAGMKETRVWSVFEDAARSEKNKGKNDRDHYVVVNPATRMSPQNVAFQRLPDLQRCLPSTKLV